MADGVFEVAELRRGGGGGQGCVEAAGEAAQLPDAPWLALDDAEQVVAGEAFEEETGPPVAGDQAARRRYADSRSARGRKGRRLGFH